MNMHARSETAVPAIDEAAIENHIGMLHRLAAASGEDGLLVLFSVGENAATGGKIDELSLHFRIGDVDGMTQAAKAWCRHPYRNVYAPWAVFSTKLERGKKGGEQDLVAVLALVADQDNDTGKSGALPLAAPYEIESSCGNFQAVYPLSRALPLAEAKPIGKALADAAGCDSGTKDMSHVWRVPGTLNWPSKTKLERGRSPVPQLVTVAKPWTGELIEPETLVATVAGKSRKSNGEQEPGSGGASDASVEQLLARCSAAYRKLITSPPAGPFEDRSAIAFSVISYLLRKTFSTEDIKRLIEAHPQGIGGRYANGKDLDADIRRAQEKAERGTGDPDAWTSPDLSLLGTGRRPAPEFPLPLLGQFWGFWSKRRSAAASAPVDYVATALLACAGAALGNVRWPLAGADWSEPPVLWCAEVGNPSSGKSPAMDQALAPLSALEDRLALGHDEERRAYETRKQVAEATLADWKARVTEAVKSGSTPPPKPAEAEVPTAPERPRVRVSDFTTERLAALAAGLPRGLLAVRDELSGFIGGFDRYGGGGSDRSFALEMYGGRGYVVDRVKSPEPIRVRHLTVGLLGGVQPDKLSLILDGPDDGLAARLLWTWPDQCPEFTLAREQGDDGEARVSFSRLGDLHMGTDMAGQPEPVRVRLTPAAEEVLEEFAREMQRRGEDASGTMAGALGKARGHVLRLAAVLTFLWWCGDRDAREPTTISAEAVTAAAALLDAYFLPMAERAFGDAAIPPADRAAMALARHLRRLGLETFNARTLRNSIGGVLREADAMKRACADLAEAGLIRPIGAKPGPQGGRPSSDWEVNPALHRRPA